MELKKLKTEIYHEIVAFLKAYQTQDKQTLQERFDIYGDFLEEIYEMLDFVEDKNDLYLFPIEEMDKKVYGTKNLQLFDDEDFDPNDPDVFVECCLYLDKEIIATIVDFYRLAGP